MPRIRLEMGGAAAQGMGQVVPPRNRGPKSFRELAEHSGKTGIKYDDNGIKIHSIASSTLSAELVGAHDAIWKFDGVF